MAQTYQIKSGDTLSGIAQQNNTSVSALQQLNPSITNPNLIQAGASLNIPTLNGSPIINTNALQQNGTQPQLPSVTPTLTPQQFVAGLTPITPVTPTPVNPTAPGATAAATGQIGTLEGQRSTLSKRLADAQQQLLGQGSEQQKLEAAAGIPQSVKDLNALNEQIVLKKAAFDKAEQNFQSGQVGTQELSTGKVAQIQRNAAVELGGLSALYLAKSGSLESAKAEVDRTLKLEFDPIKQEIENTKQFLDLNYQDLSRAEQQQANALKVQLDREDRAATLAQQNRTLNANMALELYKDGKLDQNGFSSILSGNSTIASALKDNPVNAAMLGTDPLTSLQTIISSSGAKTDDKLKLTGSVISAAQKFAENNPTGDFAGLGLIRPGRFTIGPQGQSNQSYLSGLTGTVESWMTGASVSELQQERIRKDLIPKKSDTDWQVRNKLNALTNYMLDYASGNLATQGINYRPVTVDLFTVKTDPLNLNLGPQTTNETNPLGLKFN